MKTMTAAVARDNLPKLLDDCERGIPTLIIRHSRPAALMLPMGHYNALQLFRRASVLGAVYKIMRDNA